MLNILLLLYIYNGIIFGRFLNIFFRTRFVKLSLKINYNNNQKHYVIVY